MMRRLALCAVLALAAAQLGPIIPPPRQKTEQMLKLAVDTSSLGTRARARLTDQAAQRVNELVAALKHADDDVRVSAAWGLRFSASKEKAVAPLTAALLDENFSVSRAAAVSLNHFAAAAEPLRKLMAHADGSTRWRGVINVDYLAGQLSPASRTALVDQLGKLAQSDPVDFIRADAAWTLRHFSGEGVAEALAKCLADPSGRVRWRARESLLKGGVSKELAKRGSAERQRVLAALLKILETHRGKPDAARAAVEVLTELVVQPIGADPAGWRKLVQAMEGGK